MSMACRQCEQTAGGVKCTIKGVCGKDPDTATLQDLLIHILKSIGYLAEKLKVSGWQNKEVDLLIAEGLFTTITNVNFDPKKLETIIRRAYYGFYFRPGYIWKRMRQIEDAKDLLNKIKAALSILR